MAYSNCESCPYILQKVNSCYMNYNFAELSLFELLFEYTMIFCSIYPYLLGLYFLIIPIFQRTARNMILNAMFVLSTLGCELLKRVYKQPRPEGSCSAGHGFPSSHAGMSGFLVTFFLIELLLLIRNKKRQFCTKWHYPLQQLFVFFTSPLVLYSRHYLNYHTQFQIVIGFLLGIVSAAIVCAFVFFQIDNQKSFFVKILTKLQFQNDYEDAEKYPQNEAKDRKKD